MAYMHMGQPVHVKVVHTCTGSSYTYIYVWAVHIGIWEIPWPIFILMGKMLVWVGTYIAN